jgi:hypothetical protein
MSGEPSFVQKRITSSSKRVSQVGQYFIGSRRLLGDEILLTHFNTKNGGEKFRETHRKADA